MADRFRGAQRNRGHPGQGRRARFLASSRNPSAVSCLDEAENLLLDGQDELAMTWVNRAGQHAFGSALPAGW